MSQFFCKHPCLIACRSRYPPYVRPLTIAHDNQFPRFIERTFGIACVIITKFLISIALHANGFSAVTQIETAWRSTQSLSGFAISGRNRPHRQLPAQRPADDRIMHLSPARRWPQAHPRHFMARIIDMRRLRRNDRTAHHAAGPSRLSVSDSHSHPCSLIILRHGFDLRCLHATPKKRSAAAPYFPARSAGGWPRPKILFPRARRTPPAPCHFP